MFSVYFPCCTQFVRVHDMCVILYVLCLQSVLLVRGDTALMSALKHMRTFYWMKRKVAFPMMGVGELWS